MVFSRKDIVRFVMYTDHTTRFLQSTFCISMHYGKEKEKYVKEYNLKINRYFCTE